MYTSYIYYGNSVNDNLLINIERDVVDKEIVVKTIAKSSTEPSRILICQNICHLPVGGLFFQNADWAFSSQFDNVHDLVGGTETDVSENIELYDPKTDRWQYAPEIIISRKGVVLAILKDRLMFAVGGYDKDNVEYLGTIAMLDISSESPCWKPMVDMIVKRDYPVVGVINDYLYAVGGCDQSSQCLDTVECYHPSLDKWKPVAKMSVCRSGFGVAVLHGVLYAVGGHDRFNHLSSVVAYRPSTGVWTSITDMHLPRKNAGVVTLDGLLYVVGGYKDSSILCSTECYNTQTNSWTIVTASMNDERIQAGVVAINRPRYFTTC
ncbi:kelch-like protein 2 [Acyrthosiphon pisum]|uniref:Kelch-like protein diablo n=1 Tax=Acyrthosiphon pisum TaxID=7029 RepID=A0A8R2JL91_ACYPI|nr:kelch-like protein 2 [Acyrthosiphon pisum]